MTERDGKATGWKAFIRCQWVSEGSGKATKKRKPAGKKKSTRAKAKA